MPLGHDPRLGLHLTFFTLPVCRNVAVKLTLYFFDLHERIASWTPNDPNLQPTCTINILGNKLRVIFDNYTHKLVMLYTQCLISIVCCNKTNGTDSLCKRQMFIFCFSIFVHNDVFIFLFEIKVPVKLALHVRKNLCVVYYFR